MLTDVIDYSKKNALGNSNLNGPEPPEMSDSDMKLIEEIANLIYGRGPDEGNWLFEKIAQSILRMREEEIKRLIAGVQKANEQIRILEQSCELLGKR
jgi:hypothetical protein